MPDWARGLRKFLMDLLTFLGSLKVSMGMVAVPGMASS